ncbi:hypothetical protein MKX03_019146 [Papaver bracteatum]|nr:hypothetical protein MKX03_019146 [Papaver bracteatum]
MILSMSNLLEYDVYDIKLTTVKTNINLRKLLQNTTHKSVMVIEDIDCSLDFKGKCDLHLDDQKRKITLLGILNFTDGLWSACDKERIIVFTANYVEKLDLALIIRGRMDKQIEMT